MVLLSVLCIHFAPNCNADQQNNFFSEKDIWDTIFETPFPWMIHSPWNVFSFESGSLYLEWLKTDWHFRVMTLVRIRGDEERGPSSSEKTIIIRRLFAEIPENLQTYALSLPYEVHSFWSNGTFFSRSFIALVDKNG